MSGLLGVGGGIVTVPLVHLVMGAPMKVAVATSNFMIGMTAAAGAYAYLFRGDVDPRLAAPMVLGVAAGRRARRVARSPDPDAVADGLVRGRRRLRGVADGPSGPGVGMNDDGRDAGELGRGIAAILARRDDRGRAAIGVGFIVALDDGPAVEGRAAADRLPDGAAEPDAPVAVGLLALTLLPLVAIALRRARLRAQRGAASARDVAWSSLALLAREPGRGRGPRRGRVDRAWRARRHSLAPEGEYPRQVPSSVRRSDAPPGGSGRPVQRSGETFGNSSRLPARAAASPIGG